jgi:hypothetical protein
MQKMILVVVLAGCASGCNKASAPASSPSAASSSSSTSTASAPISSAKNDAVQQKLVEFAGTAATDCGRVASQTEDQLKPASNCAMDAAKGKHAFYVAYDMPGMTVGVAGNTDGNLFTVQAQGSDVSSGACPSQLRVAPSGRVTCFAPGDMGSMGAGVHNNTSAPSGMTNPHTGGASNAPPPKHF